MAGEDYGPAPGMGFPRTKGGIRDWAKGANPGYEKIGLPSVNPFNPSNKPMEDNMERDAYIPAPGEAPPDPLGGAPMEPGMGAAQAKEQGPSLPMPPPGPMPKTPTDFISDLVLNRNVPFGEAIGIMETLYDEGDEYVKGLYNIDEMMRHRPSTAQRAGEAGLRGAMRLPVAAADKAASGISALTGAPVNPNALNSEELARQTEIAPPGTAAGAANLVGELSALQGPAGLAGKLGVAAILRLPKYAKAAEMIAAVSSRASMGKAITSNLIEHGAEQLAGATTRGNAIGQGLAILGAGALQDDSVTDIAINAATLYGAGKVGKFLLNKLPGLNKVFGTNGYTEAVKWISSKTGLTPQELTGRIKSFDDILQGLAATDAPPAVLATFFNEIPGKLWSTSLGTHLGMWAGASRISGEAFEQLVTNIPTKIGVKERNLAIKAAQRAYFRTAEHIATEETDTLVSGARKLRKGFAKTTEELIGAVTPKAPRTVKLHVWDQPRPSAGANIYMGSQSRLANAGRASGPSQVQAKTFVNPLTVTYDAGKSTPAEAILKYFRGEGGYGRASLYIMNKLAPSNTKIYNDVAKEFAFRSAKRAGYDSVVMKGATAADDMVIDLLAYKPQEDLAGLVDRIEDSVRTKYASNLENFPLIPIGIGAATAATAMLIGDPAEAIDFTRAAKLAAEEGDDVSKLLMRLYHENGAGDSGLRYTLDWMLNRSGHYPSGIATQMLKEIQSVHDVVSKTPGKVFMETAAETGFRGLPREHSFDSLLSADILHPDIGVIGNITGQVNKKGVLHTISINGYGPGMLGPRGLVKIRTALKNDYGIMAIDDGMRLTGTAGKYRTSEYGRRAWAKLLIPVTIGSATLWDDKADAGIVDPKKLAPIAESVTKDIAESGGLLNPLHTFLEKVEEKYPATGNLLWRIYEKSILRAEKEGSLPHVSKTQLLGDYTKVREDIATKPLKVSSNPQELVGNVAEALYIGPQKGHIQYAINHPLSGPVADIGGYVDPIDGKWLLDVVGARRAGIGVKALESIVSHARAIGATNGIKGKLGKLALIAAATGTATAMDWAWPKDADASPIGKWFGRGIKGISDDVIGSMAKADSPGAMLAAIQAARAGGKEALGEVSGAANERLFAAGVTNPSEALGPLWARMFAFAGDPTLRPAANILRLPANAIDDLGYDILITNLIDKQGKMLTNRNSISRVLGLQVDDLLTKGGITKDNFDELHTAIRGLVRLSNGSLEQRAKGITPKISKTAEGIREITDDIYKLVTGIDSRASSILKEFQLDETPDTWKLMQFIQAQTDLSQGLPKWNGRHIKASEISAAERLRGMVNPEPWHTLDTKYVDGYMTMMPVAGERARLLDEVQRITEMYPGGWEKDPKASRAMKTIKDRLATLQEMENKTAARKIIPTNILPKKHFYGPISEAEDLDIPEITKEKDVKKIVRSYIDGALGKVYFDEQLYYARGLAAAYESTGTPGGVQSAGYIRELMNVLRGIKSLNSDSRTAAIINYYIHGNRAPDVLRKMDARTVQHIRDYAGKVMQYHYITKLGLSIKYPIVNMTQVALTTAPVTGWGHLASAVGKVLSHPKEAYEEAVRAGILKGESRFAEEAGVSLGGKLAKAADFFPSKTEDFNRVTTYHAAKLQALEGLAKGKFKVPKYIRYFDHSILRGGTDEQIAEAYAKAVVHTTQFVFGPLGRPLALSGGAVNRLVGQFKSFSLSYASLLLDMAKHATAEKDPLPLLRAVTSLTLLGGATAVFGEAVGGTVIQGVKQAIAKLGGNPDIVPEGSIIGKAMEIAGFDFGIDFGQSVSPFAMPNPATQADSFTSWALGPTLGGAYDIGTALYRRGQGDLTTSKAVNKIGRTVLPIAVSGAEALQEAGIGRGFFDRFNYRGGIYSDTGEPLVAGRSPAQIALRGLGLQPSVRSQRADYIKRIQEAIEHDDPETARELVIEAKSKGFILDKRALGNIKGRISRQKNMELKPNK